MPFSYCVIAIILNDIHIYTRWFRQETSAIDLPEIRRPYDSNYTSYPNVVSWVTKTTHLQKKNKLKPLNTGVCTVLWTVQFFVVYKGDVEFDMKNGNSSIVFLFMKSKCANFSCALLDNICTLKKCQKLICFPGNCHFKKYIVLDCTRFIY